jgi:hypothetical protein
MKIRVEWLNLKLFFIFETPGLKLFIFVLMESMQNWSNVFYRFFRVEKHQTQKINQAMSNTFGSGGR